MNLTSSDALKTKDKYGIIRYFNSAGVYHRLNGPAIKWPDGYREWWINGRIFYSVKNYKIVAVLVSLNPDFFENNYKT